MDYVIDTDDGYEYFNNLVTTNKAKIIKENPLVINYKNKNFNIDLTPQYQDKFNIQKIIYGKDNTQGITNISVLNDLVYIFTETGYHTIPYKHWVLSPKHYEGFSKLKGREFYQYIKEYNVSDYELVKDSVYKNRMYTLSNYTEAFMIRNGYTYFKGLKTTDVSILSFDIETTGLDPYADDACVLLITNTFRKNGEYIKKTFCIDDYDLQEDMIKDWADWVYELDPSIILGHNIIIFDLPYIKAQMNKIGQELYLGKFGTTLNVEPKVRELRVDGTQTYSYNRINIFGRDIVDTFFLAIKADSVAKKYESYGLKKIIQQEGLEKKDRQHYEAGDIAKNWNNPEEKKKIIQYAKDDADDPIKLFDIMIAPFFYLTPHIPKSFQIMIESATGSQINSLMVRSYLQDGFAVAKGDKKTPFEGAISFGNVGIYDNVLKIDVKSLYPSIMRHYKVFPKGKDYNGNFLKALDYFTEKRFENQAIAKKTGDKYYSDLEQTGKVFINSTYGAMGADGLNYNYIDGAALVTKIGRDIITKACEWATGQTTEKVVKHITNKGKPNEEIEYEWKLGQKVCEGKGYTISNCDTDSISFTANKELSKDEQDDIIKDVNSQFPSSIYFANDGYFKRVIILKAKNYILFDGNKIKLKGSSLKDKKKEPALREMAGKMIDALVHDETNLLNIYHEYIKEVLNVKDISRWATKKTMSKAILNCATDPNARLNERKVYDAVAPYIPIQEGDKVYLYPAIIDSQLEVKQMKNGSIKEKRIDVTGLKLIDRWNKDHDIMKLVERVYEGAELLSGVNNTEFINYALVKNKKYLDNFY